ncbi:Uncharacterised protein [Mycobacterium tuberculosis]|uniref:Uncharacterized protein n=1 Tax=Mycobacterium tuberculosis TaxID=1773 RepID=A0A655AMN9_MYCTX|nr:Uncharacterised protein [Mycobacterium tuberculosis]CKR74086.1 Uncharacterised protein [Mycobacterium tuberculosis]CKS41768.1 Uncharacterised protein [Mycobacterium tuberculosis]CKT35129.1 Uncharacterised protein [Mycobacterium tuberculosis]CKT54459.1 Uncharacterised protein [Mycobacterium tuberculosis]
MAQCQIVWAKLMLDRRAERTRLDARGTADTVNLKHRAHGSDVDRDHRLIEARLDTANHRAATTVWDDRNPLARTPIQHVDHVLLAAGSGDEVGQVVELALQVACDVAIRFAARVSGPIDEIA